MIVGLHLFVRRVSDAIGVLLDNYEWLICLYGVTLGNEETKYLTSVV